MTNVAITTLGCAKNLVDSEVLLGLLQGKGVRVVEELDEADVVIVNTCGFVADAQKESVETILQLAHLKSQGRFKKLIVTGCLTQIFGAELKRQVPQVDAWIGVNDIHAIGPVLEEVAAGRHVFRTSSKPYLYDHTTPRTLLTPPHYAYIKISEGCDHLCSFCIIPKIKGKLRSRPGSSIVEEARGLLDFGVKELIIIGQDTTEYGRDLGNPDALARLLRKLAAIEGDFWIRVLYTYPSHWTGELVEVFAGEEKICKYVDMPIQHVNDEILKSMRREESRATIEGWLDAVRSRMPEVFVRTSVIVGYPGETEEAFEELCDFIKQVKFERLGAFTYSREKDSAAADMAGQIPDDVKAERYDTVMRIQQEVSLENNSRLLGRRLRCIVDGPAEEGSPADVVGRTYGDSPEVDGRIYLAGKDMGPGDFVEAEVTGFAEYDLVGRIAGQE